MKTIKKQNELVALLLSILIFLEGCTVYQSATVTLDEAAQRATNVKITTNSDHEYRFESVKLENGEYFGYGSGSVSQTNYKVYLKEDNVKKVQLKDYKKSNTRTYVTLGAIGAAAVVLALSSIKAPINKL